MRALFRELHSTTAFHSALVTLLPFAHQAASLSFVPSSQFDGAEPSAANATVLVTQNGDRPSHETHRKERRDR